MQFNISITSENVDEVIDLLNQSAAEVVELKKNALITLLIEWSSANATVEGSRRKLDWLECLEQAGVDNWTGVEQAHEFMKEYEGGEDSS